MRHRRPYGPRDRRRRIAMYERDRILAAVDLAALADELLGARKGTHASGSWPCPNPQHAQTGRTPPVSVFRSRRGEQRWRCHGCGDGGSAIDLVMAATRCDVREAFDVIARRVGAPPREPDRHVPTIDRARPRDDGRGLAAYVQDCADRLWRRDGGSVRAWLMGERGLPAPVLRANAVGADPGPSRQSRPEGVPRAGLAAVFPAIEHGEPVYAQLRRLRPRPDQPKFLNVSGVLAANPKVARYRPVEDRGDIVVVTEGPIDALSAAAAGFRAVAVFGATSADPDVASRLAATPGRLVLAFDADTAGRTGSERLERMLRDVQRPARALSLPDGVNDLNDWMQLERRGWLAALEAAVADALDVRRTAGVTLAR